MIVSVALNPALLVDYTAERVRLGTANPIATVRTRVGGRGLTVARLVHTFGHDVTAAGLAGGSAGEQIRAGLARAGVATSFTRIAAESRRVVQVRDVTSGQTTSLAEPAPYITTEELGRLAADYRALLDGATAVVLAGSLPAGLPAEIYGSLISYAAEAGVPVVLDAGGSALRNGAGRGPALIIPEQPAEAAGLEPADDSSVVLTTDRGVLASTLDGRWLAEISPAAIAAARRSQPAEPKPAAFRDGLVAGFVPGIALGWSWPDMLRHALALASSAAPDGEADLAAYEALLPAVLVTGPESD
ncbi:MAG TPA: PfkB family carbohydrate kinase [Streptosporangiaceae bacterium]|nr:PfkB family carbohydrate kinase [Streptosporangiaceae bacterium]